MKYDDASWHSGGEFPSDSPSEYGATHIALFLKWCFIKGWASDLHLLEERHEVESVKSGEMAATDFLFTFCDGKLWSEDLNSAGNRFAQHYYGKDGLYLADYAAHFGALMYLAPESAHDFGKFSALLEDRFRKGILTHQLAKRPPKPWWKVW